MPRTPKIMMLTQLLQANGVPKGGSSQSFLTLSIATVLLPRIVQVCGPSSYPAHAKNRKYRVGDNQMRDHIAGSDPPRGAFGPHWSVWSRREPLPNMQCTKYSFCVKATAGPFELGVPSRLTRDLETLAHPDSTGFCFSRDSHVIRIPLPRTGNLALVQVAP